MGRICPKVDLSLPIHPGYALVLTCNRIGRERREWWMKKMTGNPEAERLESGAEKYAAYLEMPEGRLRLDLAFANLQELLPKATQPLCALDIGCGTGALAVRLARLGYRVTMLDPSQPMLDYAERAAVEAGVREQVVLKRGDASELASLFHAESFDVILCHNVLEFVDDPNEVLHSVARLMRDSSAILSVLVRTQPGEVLKAALVTGDLTAADTALTSQWGEEALYGGKVRLFTFDTLTAMLKGASLAVEIQRGVRVAADYLPPQVSRTAEYEQIIALEYKLGRLPEFAAIARYAQCLARAMPRAE